MNPNQMPFPFSLMMPPWAHPPQQQIQAAEVPARVRTALAFLESLTIKTMTRVAVWENGCEQIDPPRLTDEESATQATACMMLSSYFAGKLPPDRWEKAEAEERCLGSDRPGMVLGCFACHPSPKPDCRLCKGSGTILVFPSSEGR